MNWLALTSALGQEPEILDWFDERMALGDLPLPSMSRLRREILRRGRLKDWLAFGEPLEMASDLLESIEQTGQILADAPALLAEQPDEVDCEVALWRRVAEFERPAQLAQVDAAIDASERAQPIRNWLAQSQEAVVKALLQHIVD